MLLTIGELSYTLAEDEDPNRILDDVVAAAKAGAGVVRFTTLRGAELSVVVTAYIPVVISTPVPSPATPHAGADPDGVGIAFVDFDWWDL